MLVLPPEYSVALEKQPIDAILGAAAGLIGLPDDPRGRALALSCMQAAIDRINAEAIWMFTRKEFQAGQDTPFTAGDTTFALPSDWGFPEAESAYVLDSTGKQMHKLEWKPWEVFRDLTPDPNNGTPRYLSIRSPLDGTAYIWPSADPTTFATLRIPYLRRLTSPMDGTDLVLTPEARHALKAWTEAYVMQRRYKDKPPIYIPFWQAAKEALLAALGADNRRREAELSGAVPDEVGRLSNTDSFPTGEVWIRL